MSRRKAISILSKLDIVSLGLNVIIGILLVPYYFTFFTIEIYGFWIATSGLIVIFDLFDFGISTIFTQRIGKYFSKSNFQKVLNYLYTGLILYLIIGVIILILGLIFSNYLDDIFSLNEKDEIITSCFRIALFTTFFKIINGALNNFGNSTLKPLAYSITSIFSLIICVIVIIFLLNHGFSLYSLAIGYLTQSILTLFGNIFFSIRQIMKMNNSLYGVIKKNIFIDYISNIKFLFFSRTAESIVKNIEPAIIAFILGGQITSVYVLAKKIADVIYQLLNIFSGASFYSLINIQNSKKIVEDDFRIVYLNQFIFYLSVFSLSLFVSGNSDFLTIWVGKEFVVSSYVTFSFALSCAMMIWLNFRTIYYFSKDKIKRVSFILFFESIFRICLIYFLIKVFGIIGGPIAIFISNMLGLLIIDKNKLFVHIQLFPCILILVISIFISNINFIDNKLFSFLIKICFQIIGISLIYILNKKLKKNINLIYEYIFKT